MAPALQAIIIQVKPERIINLKCPLQMIIVIIVIQSDLIRVVIRVVQETERSGRIPAILPMPIPGNIKIISRCSPEEGIPAIPKEPILGRIAVIAINLDLPVLLPLIVLLLHPGQAEVGEEILEEEEEDLAVLLEEAEEEEALAAEEEVVHPEDRDKTI
jgi:hypothetical protein